MDNGTGFCGTFFGTLVIVIDNKMHLPERYRFHRCAKYKKVFARDTKNYKSTRKTNEEV